MSNLPLAILLGFWSGAIIGFFVAMFWTIRVMLKQLNEVSDE